MRLTARIYRATFISGLILVAPLLIGVSWYVGKAYVYVTRYERALGKPGTKSPVDLELFQIALHDALVRDLLRLGQRDREPSRSLPTYSISLPRQSLDELATESREDQDDYVKALLEKDGKIHEIKLRYRGEQPWHSLGAQRSMKVRLDRGDLVDGVRVFNLWNDPTPFGLEDQIILDLARAMGLLAPEYRPVWVRINNLDMGVYRFEAQPDETLLRQSHRIPGNMYSGDSKLVDPATKTGAVFSDPPAWQKISARSEDDLADRADLLRLLDQVNTASFREFATYAEAAIDLEKYARFDALDVVFGGSEHDCFSNHKLYFDPYRGKMEPVAFSFRGFQHEATFNVIDHPLLIRLKQTPGYLALRDREVYSLLIGPASVSAIRTRADRAIDELSSDLLADPNWDAYKLLPRASRLHRFLVRPMTLDRWILASAREIDEFERRSRFLLDVLESSSVGFERSPFVSAPELGASQWVSTVLATVDGHSAKRLQRVRARGCGARTTGRAPGPCALEIAVYADQNLDGIFDPHTDVELARSKSGEVELTGYNQLTPRSTLIPHPDPSEKRGRVRVTSEPTSFVYFVVAVGTAPDELSLELADIVTGGSHLRLVRPTERLAIAAAESTSIDSVPRLQPGERSPHPWAFSQPEPARELVLGPGEVSLSSSETYSSAVTTRILPGTALRLGPGVSLVFQGKLLAEGTLDLPILVTSREEGAFGGIALAGPGTRGSKLRWVRMERGSRAQSTAAEYTGLFSAYDTRDLTVSDSTFVGGERDDDVFHLYGVTDLSMHEVTIASAPVDALDLEFVEGELRGLEVKGAKDDCLDLMGSRLTVTDAVLVGCANNGVSAGEETELLANGLVVAGAKTGVLAKNASSVRLIRSLLFDTERALRARAHEVRYGGTSRIGATDVFVVEARSVSEADRSSTIELSGVEVGIPEGTDLRHIITEVLQIDDGGDLVSALRELERSVGR
ncbi:MAG: CotH kinase family protein [Deltaproteobacteria bacterium]|nr:CotH kinase family protein [Deltaproteobacteria bacterium]